MASRALTDSTDHVEDEGLRIWEILSGKNDRGFRRVRPWQVEEGSVSVGASNEGVADVLVGRRVAADDEASRGRVDGGVYVPRGERRVVR